MLLFTAFIFGFALSSVESQSDLSPFEECQNKFNRYQEEIEDENQTIKEFDSWDNYDDIINICENENLDEACVENFYKRNILNLNYEELVKACNCSSQDCGGDILTAGFGGSVSGKQIMCGYLICLLAVFGIVGNAMSMKVFWQPEMWKSKFNQILFAIGTTDTLFLVVQIISVGLLSAAGPNSDLDLAKPVTYPLRGFAYICSIYLLILLTFERYVVLCHLNRIEDMKAWTNKLIGLVFLFSLIWNIPNCFFWKWVTSNNITSVVKTDLADDKYGSYEKFYVTYGHSIIKFFLPMVILIVLNSLIVKQLFTLKRENTDLLVKNMNDDSKKIKKKEERQTRRRVTKMSLFLVGVFLMCNIVDIVWWLLRRWEKELPPILTCSAELAETLNSSVNVIIYSIFGKAFREKFVTLFCPSNEQGEGRLNIVVKKQPNATRSTLYTETAVPTGTQVVSTEV